MLKLEIKDLNIAREVKTKLLDTKPRGSYSAKYVEFVVRTTLSCILENVSSISAVWNVEQSRWEGNMNYLGKDYYWIITE